jgi:hypothetical protein
MLIYIYINAVFIVVLDSRQLYVLTLTLPSRMFKHKNIR